MKEEQTGEALPIHRITWVNEIPVTYLAPQPNHRGQGYAGEQLVCPYPAQFGNITSIQFYPNSIPQDEP